MSIIFSAPQVEIRVENTSSVTVFWAGRPPPLELVGHGDRGYTVGPKSLLDPGIHQRLVDRRIHGAGMVEDELDLRIHRYRIV
jgi:hypothetical protein